MNNEFPDEWEPGHNIGWRAGHYHRSRKMAKAFFLFAIVAASLLLILAALSSCAAFVNQGEMMEKGIFEKRDSIKYQKGVGYVK